MRRIDRFLISILWINAIAITALWFFDKFFRFNITSGAHWKYLAELQVTGNVDIKFYVFLAAFIVISLMGLYFLVLPSHGKIIMSQPAESQLSQTETIQKLAIVPKQSEEVPFAHARPPRLHLDNIFIPTRRERLDIDTVTNIAPVQVIASGITTKIKDLFTKIGFTIKNIKKIEEVKLDFCAIGTDDIMIIGLLVEGYGEITASEQGESIWSAGGKSFKSPVSQISTAVQRLKDLFNDVLEDGFQVNIVPFVFVEDVIVNRFDVQTIWDTLGINVFSDIALLEDFLNKNKPKELDEDERSEFNAFSEFIDTVAEHFEVRTE